MSTTTLATEDYQFLKDYIHRESGILLDDDKHYLLTARLTPVIELLHMESLTALARALRGSSNPQLRKKVVEAMTTHETLFFRDASPFEALKSTILPQLIKLRETSRTIRIWSAAASSGQEPYSLAMTLLEMGLEDWNLQITGTDISEQILSRAREGRYLQIEVNRALYMDEKTLARTAGLATLSADIESLAQSLADVARSGLSGRRAAAE